MPRHGRAAPMRTVQRLRIAYQDAQRTFWNGSGNAHRNAAHNALAAIGPKHGFNSDLITGARFRHVSARTLQHSGVALTLQIKLKRYAADGRSFKRVIVNSAKMIAQSRG